jgi:general secretion pathway protein C
LFVIGCWLAADTANQVIANALLPTTPAAVAAARMPAPPPRARSWAEREIILTRNLFHSSLDSPELTADQLQQELEKSRLPVTLLGTFASSDPNLSRATLMDKEKNETLVVGVGDQIKNSAEVMRIERRRVVITENGAPRELTFGDDGDAEPLIRRARRTAAAEPPIRRTESGIAVSRDAIQKSMRDPSELLSQARVIPKYEQGQMVGLQVNAIKPGSLFQEIGLQDGDLITQFNGIAIDSPDQSAKIFQELANASEFNVVVRGADGTESTKNFTPE